MSSKGILSGVSQLFGLGDSAPQHVLSNEAEIRQWLCARLAQTLRIEIAAVDTTKRFDAYGLDSRTGMQITGELEKAVERRLSPALFHQCPTIDAVAAELARELADAEHSL